MVRAIIIFTVVMAGSVAFLVYGNAQETALCVVGDGQDRYEKTAEFLSGVLDLSLALSTSLVSLGAALLIGLHSNVRLSLTSSVTLLLALIALAQSAAYGVWWKLQLANLWFNECYNQIASPHIQWFYQAHFLLLLGGIGSIALLVAFLSLSRVGEVASGGQDG